jgi:membrane-associated HD superfamily phosphohydrolase
MNSLIQLLEHCVFVILVVFFSFLLRRITRYEIKEEYSKIRLLRKILLIASIFFLFFVFIQEDIRFFFPLIISIGWWFLFINWRKYSILESGFSPLIIGLLSTNLLLLKAGFIIFALDSFASATLKRGRMKKNEIKSYPAEFIFSFINYIVPLFIGWFMLQLF